MNTDWSAQTATFCIPFDPDENEEADETLTLPAVPSLQQRDITEGAKLRYAVFNDAWQQVHDRVLEVASELYSPTTKELLEFTLSPRPVEGASSCIRMLLPNHELPAALVVGGDQHQIFSAYARGAARRSDLVVSQLSPSDFLNTTTVFKQLIAGFVSQDDRKGKATTTLVPYDMQLLVSWFRWKTDHKSHLIPPANGRPLGTISSKPSLVALIPDLESCNIQVLEEFIHVCSLYCDRLPLVLVLGVSKARALHDLLPRTVRTHLSVFVFNVPKGQQMFDSILREVLFSLDTPLDLVLGTSAFEWLAHSCSAYGWSVQSVLSHFQLLLMRHFRQPLTVFWEDCVMNKERYTHIVKVLSEGQTAELRAALLSHLPAMDDSNNIEELVEAIDKARHLFQDLKRNVTYGFLVLMEVQAYLKTLMSDGYKEIKASFTTLAGLVGDGKSKEVYMKLASRVKLLKRDQSQALCRRLQRLVANIPESGQDAIFLTKLNALAITIEQTKVPDEINVGPYPLSKDFSQLLEHLWSEKLKPWTGCQLHEIWHTGSISFSQDLLNPSIQAAILSALIRPGGYLLHDLTKYAVSNGASDAMTNGENGYDPQKEDTVRVYDPDTPRLFHLYMEAGRTINVYDWFGAFAVSLEGEANEDAEDADEMDADVEGRKEERRREVYARFMRSLHELDLLGMLRWTGRGTGKKGGECAAKLVWATAAQGDLV